MNKGAGPAPDDAAGLPSMLAFAVAGVLPEGASAPRLGYRLAGQGHAEERSVAGTVVAVDDGVTLGFRLPAEPIDFILLEPAAVPGSYFIPHLAYAGMAVRDLQRRVVSAHERVDQSVPDAIRFASSRGRPAVEIDVRGLVVEAGAQDRDVELVLRRDTDGALAADAFAQVVEGMSRDREGHRAASLRLERMLALVSARIGGLEDTVGVEHDAGVPRTSLGTRMDGLASANAARDARIESLVQQLAALAAAAANAAQEQSQATASVLAAIQEQSRATAALMATLEEAARAGSSAEVAAVEGREAASRDAEAVGQALGDLRTRIDRVTNAVENVFWRRWLRRLRGGGR
ncbi:hypothetical protein [Luteimonas changyuni]|uniref:hypothetical protein n=1 Tax=Luteimonas sp. MJ145 TaxID=3129234 RepID=UPI0031BA180A